MYRADAARVVTVSPQGKVAQVRQVVVKFDEAMIAFGSPSAAAPGKLACSGAPAAATAGGARWIDEKPGPTISTRTCRQECAAASTSTAA